MIDLNCFVGAWPYRRLAGTDPGSVTAALLTAGIDEALVSPLPALLHLDPLAENLWWAAELARHPRLHLAPVVNAALPELDRDLDRLLEAAGHLSAVRLAPGCHGYSLTDVVDQVRAIAARDLLVMVTLRVRDDRVESRLAPFADVPVADLDVVRRHCPDARIACLGAREPEIDELAPEPGGNLVMDISHAEGDHLVRRLVDRHGPEQLVAGTNYPLFAPGALAAKLGSPAVSAAELATIGTTNARSVLGW
jgi:hypothetical protein